MIEEERSEAAKSLPTIEPSKELVTKQAKLDKLLDLIDDITMEGEYAVLKFNNPVIIASPGNVALVAGESLIIKSVEGAIHLN